MISKEDVILNSHTALTRDEVKRELAEAVINNSDFCIGLGKNRLAYLDEQALKAAVEEKIYEALTEAQALFDDVDIVAIALGAGIKFVEKDQPEKKRTTLNTKAALLASTLQEAAKSGDAISSIAVVKKALGLI